jgi:enolase
MERLLTDTGLIDQYGIMVDASAGDWYIDGHYKMSVTGMAFEPGALVDEWLRIMDRFDLEILEDPFSETDLEAWRVLHQRRPAGTHLYGDNLTSVQPDQLDAKAHLVDGVLVKPDQNGTVTGTLRFAELARAAGLSIATSHRSIETDAPFLVHLTSDLDADYLKVGPFSDFSSVMRTNALLRGARP